MAGALGLVLTGDTVRIEGSHAIPVYVDDSLPIVGPSRACVVTSGEIPQLGGPPLAVRLAPAGTPAIGPALPVYVVSGSLGGAAAPVNAAFSNPIGTTPRLVFDAIDGLFALADGTLISTWTDQGSLLKDLTSAGALRPTKQTLNGYPCASFSGSNNMNTATFTSQAQANTVFCLLQTTNTAAQQDYLDGENIHRHLMFLAITTNNAGIYAGTVLNSTTAINGAAGVLAAGIFNGGSSKLYLNGGAAVASGAGGAQDMDQLWIGSNYTAGNKLTGKIQFVAVFHAALSTADLTTFGQYIGTRYGVTVAPFA